ncbi:citrate synthase [Roseibium hamelinense]|uniref:Citrate synthase n=1 Tax=Roseibium hamelinense TaxID=150831 RepID=A0A562SNM4_9HYPH|nr:helix-turn-helix domain-containing protein [Roseibium hamelinense]TWI82931.1 citrate synthase [Roseibium hamelinense]
MTTPVFLSAKEAATELGVQPATLYAYVSRGLIRSEPGPGKQKKYFAADVRRLQERREVGDLADPRPLTGAGVLETRLTLITEKGPHYRGQLATELARTSSLESVATLLWRSEDDPFDANCPNDPESSPATIGVLDRLMAALANWPSQDKAAYTLSQTLLQKKVLLLCVTGSARCLCAQFLPIPSTRK